MNVGEGQGGGILTPTPPKFKLIKLPKIDLRPPQVKLSPD